MASSLCVSMSLRTGEGSGAGESRVVDVDIPVEPSLCRSEFVAWNLGLQHHRGSVVSLGWRRVGECRALLLRWWVDLSWVCPRGSVASTTVVVSSAASVCWHLRSSRVERPSCWRSCLDRERSRSRSLAGA